MGSVRYWGVDTDTDTKYGQIWAKIISNSTFSEQMNTVLARIVRRITYVRTDCR